MVELTINEQLEKLTERFLAQISEIERQVKEMKTKIKRRNDLLTFYEIIKKQPPIAKLENRKG